MDGSGLPKFGRYVASAKIGEGSLGVVYRARHEELDRDAAVKVLRPEVRSNEAAVAGMVAEASTLARLDHPNIVALYDFVQEPERIWLAEQWVDGAPLDAILQAHGRLTPEQSLGVVSGALTGLAYAHDNGVVHRDVSASNVLADMVGTSMLVDFGLASPVPTESGSGSGSGGVVGTPAYLSPEAAGGEPVGKPGDVYSAAALTYHLLSGLPVFAGTAWEMVAAHRDRVAPRLKGHGPRLAGLLERSLAKDPSVRPPDGAAFLAELEEGAAEKYGADWRTRASIAGLVASTLAVVGSVAGGGATVVAAGVPQTVTGASRAVVSTGRRVGLKPMIAAGGVAAVVVAGVVVGLTMTSGGDEDKGADLSSQPTLSDEELREQEREQKQKEREEKIAELETSVPAGIYRFVAVGTFNLRGGSTRPLKEGGTWNFAGANCSAKACQGQVEASNGAVWRYTWDGTAMSIDRPVRQLGWTACMDRETGEELPISESASQNTSTFKVGAVNTTPGATSAPPAAFSFSYDGVANGFRFRGTCTQSPEDRLSWTADVTLTRKG